MSENWEPTSDFPSAYYTFKDSTITIKGNPEYKNKIKTEIIQRLKEKYNLDIDPSIDSISFDRPMKK